MLPTTINNPRARRHRNTTTLTNPRDLPITNKNITVLDHTERPARPHRRPTDQHSLLRRQLRIRIRPKRIPRQLFRRPRQSIHSPSTTNTLTTPIQNHTITRSTTPNNNTTTRKHTLQLNLTSNTSNPTLRQHKPDRLAHNLNTLSTTNTITRRQNHPLARHIKRQRNPIINYNIPPPVPQPPTSNTTADVAIPTLALSPPTKRPTIRPQTRTRQHNTAPTHPTTITNNPTAQRKEPHPRIPLTDTLRHERPMVKHHIQLPILIRHRTRSLRHNPAITHHLTNRRPIPRITPRLSSNTLDIQHQLKPLTQHRPPRPSNLNPRPTVHLKTNTLNPNITNTSTTLKQRAIRHQKIRTLANLNSPHHITNTKRLSRMHRQHRKRTLRAQTASLDRSPNTLVKLTPPVPAPITKLARRQTNNNPRIIKPPRVRRSLLPSQQITQTHRLDRTNTRNPRRLRITQRHNNHRIATTNPRPTHSIHNRIKTTKLKP